MGYLRASYFAVDGVLSGMGSGGMVSPMVDPSRRLDGRVRQMRANLSEHGGVSV